MRPGPTDVEAASEAPRGSGSQETPCGSLIPACWRHLTKGGLPAARRSAVAPQMGSGTEGAGLGESFRISLAAGE